jgi:hypothetical protein
VKRHLYGTKRSTAPRAECLPDFSPFTDQIFGAYNRVEDSRMPLRDHFRPPIWNKASWEGFHGGWPMEMVRQLGPQLPDNFTAEPRVHLGSYFEIDVCAYEDEPHPSRPSAAKDHGGTATAIWSPPRPTLAIDAEPSEQYAYEVLIFDQSRGRLLVAAVEIVSPANKDRPKNRREFVAKCAALLGQGVCVSMVDLVTTRQFNLYTDLLDLIGQSDPAFSPAPPATYAITCRGRKVGSIPRLESWAYPLVVGQPLPTLPVWLSHDLAVSLELEISYEETCRVLRIA